MSFSNSDFLEYRNLKKVTLLLYTAIQAHTANGPGEASSLAGCRLKAHRGLPAGHEAYLRCYYQCALGMFDTTEWNM